MAKCCGNTCACKVISGIGGDGHSSVKVTGTGTTQDPFVIQGVTVVGIDTDDVDLTVSYDDVSDTYTISAAFATTSNLASIGDVNTPAPSNGQVLSWNTATQKWVAAAPTTAAAGTIQHDATLSGDGSVGTPLQVRRSAAGWLDVAADGLTLSSLTINDLVLHFADVGARAGTTITLAQNVLSMVASQPGRISYWTGSAWADATLLIGVGGTALLELSGPYVANTAVSNWNAAINDSTDINGYVTLLDSAVAPLSAAAGVLSASFTPTSGYPVVVTFDSSSGTSLRARLYKFDSTAADFVPVANYAVKGQLSAVLY